MRYVLRALAVLFLRAADGSDSDSDSSSDSDFRLSSRVPTVVSSFPALLYLMRSPTVGKREISIHL